MDGNGIIRELTPRGGGGEEAKEEVDPKAVMRHARRRGGYPVERD